MRYYISADNARSHQRTSPMHKKAAAIRCGQGLPENLRTNALRKSLGFCPLKGIHSKGDPRAVKAQGFAIRAALEREGRKEGRKEGTKPALTVFGKGKPSSEKAPFPSVTPPLSRPVHENQPVCPASGSASNSNNWPSVFLPNATFALLMMRQGTLMILYRSRSSGKWFTS